MKRKHKITAVILIILVVSTVVFLAGISKKKGNNVLKIVTDKIDLYVRDFHYTEVGDPELTWKIDADSAQYVKNRNLAFLKNVNVTLITSGGATFHLRGDEGRFHTQSRDIDVFGNVEILSDRGDRFKTDRLRYIFSEKRVHTDTVVVMENQKLKVTGTGLSVSLENRSLALLSDVSAFICDYKITF